MLCGSGASSSNDLDVLDSILKSQEKRFAVLTTSARSDKTEPTTTATTALAPLLSKTRGKNVIKRKGRNLLVGSDNDDDDEFEVGCTPSNKLFDFNASCEIKACEESAVEREVEEEEELSLFDYEADLPPSDAIRRLHGGSPGGLSHCSSIVTLSPQSLTRDDKTINILSSTSTCRSNPRGSGSGRLSLTFCDEEENIIVRVPVERGLTFFGGEHHHEDAAEWDERPTQIVTALSAVNQRRKEFCLALRSFAEIVESDDDDASGEEIIIKALPSKTKTAEEEGAVGESTPSAGTEDDEAATANQSKVVSDLNHGADAVGLTRQIFSIFDIPVDTVVNTKTLSVHELRVELKARGQSVEGTKSDLVRRLDKYLVANESLLLVNSRNEGSTAASVASGTVGSGGEHCGRVGKVSKKSSTSMAEELLTTTATASSRSGARKRLREPYGVGVGVESSALSSYSSAPSSTWLRSARGHKLRAKNMAMVSATDAVESFLASL